MSHDVVEQLASVAVLHDHVQFLLRFDDFVQLNHVRVPNLLKNLDFPRDTLNVFLIVDLVLLEDFNGNLCQLVQRRATYLFTCQGVLAELHLAKGSLSKMFAYEIVRI